MDLRKLHYFVEAVEQGSLGKAAEKLRVSQPALTKSLRLLEDELGVRLLDRLPVGVKPTVYGNSLFAHAKAMVAEADHARTEIQRLRGEEPGYVRIGTLPSVSAGLIARAVAALATRNPPVKVRVVDKQNYELLPALRRGEFDFVVALTDGWESESGIRQRLVLEDRLEITVRGAHPLARQNDVSYRDLLGFPWMFPIVGTTHGPLLKQLFADAGLTAPEPRVESGSIHFSKTVIRQSDCIGILPRHAMEEELRRGELTCLPFTSDLLRRTIAFYHRDHRAPSASVSAVMREIERTCRG
jgi:LysR family transcriptional regulator of gallate degradation